MQTIDEALEKLKRSKFRSSFYLTKKNVNTLAKAFKLEPALNGCF